MTCSSRGQCLTYWVQTKHLPRMYTDHLIIISQLFAHEHSEIFFWWERKVLRKRLSSNFFSFTSYVCFIALSSYKMEGFFSIISCPCNIWKYHSDSTIHSIHILNTPPGFLFPNQNYTQLCYVYLSNAV